MSNTVIAQIDLSALSHNLNLIKQMMPSQKVLPMIKANAYGHGLLRVAGYLSEEPALGVAHLSEALQIDRVKLNAKTIVVMRGFCNEAELDAFLRNPNLVACVHDQSQLSLLKNKKLLASDKLRVWLKVDTGMHRLGFLPDDFHAVYQELADIKNVSIETVLTHLADADNDDTAFTQSQLKKFTKLTSDLSVKKSVLNSAGILAYPNSAYDWVRPGVALYGGSPFAVHSAYTHKMKYFKPVMTLVSKITAVKRLLPGDRVGYNCTYRAEKEMLMAVVGIGYGDGYPRHAKTGTPVLIHGKRCPVIGRISMDMLTVDVSGLKTVSVGDEVVLWGNGLSIDVVADCADSIPHALFAGLTSRVSYNQQG